MKFLLLIAALAFSYNNTRAEELTTEQIAQIVAQAKTTPDSAVGLAIQFPQAAEAIIEAFKDEDPGLREAIAKELRWRKFICEHIDEQTIEMRSLQTGCHPKEENDNPALIHPSRS
ncbi:MAG: hypothetical protein ACU833_05610 [Gammaproteobacteria bacterium]